MPRQLHLSASAISAFKACPTRFRLKYVEGVRKDEDSDSQRVGTNWHALHEVYENAYRESGDHNDAWEAAIGHLNEVYSTIPDSKTPEEWATERAVLAYSFAAYHHIYQDDTHEALASEIAFTLPLHHPKSGMPLPDKDVVRVGKIDAIVKTEDGRVFKFERKSTSRSLDADSDYWQRLRMDTQVGFYDLAVQDLVESGELSLEGGVLAGTIYDVWRKPSIKPKKLTQKDSAAFVESKMYCDQSFNVVVSGESPRLNVEIDGVVAEVEPGKKEGTFAIRETPEMYGARLMADMMERPEYYFARREIVRTDKERRAFRTEIYNIYQAMKNYRKTGHWFKNEQQCEATFKCEYCPICYYNIPVYDGETPDGYTRIFEGK